MTSREIAPDSLATPKPAPELAFEADASSNRVEPAVDSIDEVLVAYLDGELTPEESSELDKRLADDPSFRERLRELQRAWDLLDLVPRVDVQVEFTRSTVEMIAVTAAADARQSQSARDRRRWLAAAAAAALAVSGCVGGFFFTSWLLDRPNRQLLADLPVLLDLNLYRSVESTEFLRELEKRELFSEADDVRTASDESGDGDGAPAAYSTLATGALAAPSPLDALTLASTDAARRRSLGELPTADLDSLRGKKSQFESLDEAERERLRALHREIAGTPEAARWRETMERYNDWLKSISSTERAELRELAGVANVDEKANKIADLLKAQQADHFAQLLEGRLAKEDLDKISAWIDRFLDQNESEILAALPNDLRRRLEGGDEAARRRMLAIAMFRPAGSRPPKLQRLLPEQLVGLKATLSPEAQEAWDKTTEEDRPGLAHRWIAAAFFSKAPPVSEKQLREFFKSRDAKEREWLERLPPDRTTAELRRLYYRHQFQREGRRSDRQSAESPREGRPIERPPANFD